MNATAYKRTVRASFDEAARGYDRNTLSFFDNAAEALAGALPLRGRERVLDAAAGTGKVALAVARRIPGGEVLGLDLSAGMLRRAAEKAKAAGRDNVSFRRGDVDKAVLPPAGFDGLTCGFGVHFWSDMGRSLSRLLRAVKPGGFLGMTSFADGSFEPQSSLCLNRFARYGVTLPESYSWERLDHPGKVRKLLKGLGMRRITTRRVQVGHALGAPGDWWDLVTFTGFRAFLNKLTAAQALRYKREFLREVAGTAKRGKVFLNVEALVTVAIK